MKKTLFILILSLSTSFANSEMASENIAKILTLTESSILREVRINRVAPHNRKVRPNRKVESSPLPRARLNRETRKERFTVLNIRKSREVRYVTTLTNSHLASLK
ncbi:MAG: Unknown protein [uncultured Sulfurovum sp.]|uniref:Uncharacterized protein n=1 Tax=uncultured Sulfurovum sp. TaxID=269237 RepID=A0A6S6T1V3_9BACT|nr:MAG: Unknown protein [uncultured Sulfurovum sp.]